VSFGVFVSSVFSSQVEQLCWSVVAFFVDGLFEGIASGVWIAVKEFRLGDQSRAESRLQ
jgi:hypothetical protein